MRRLLTSSAAGLAALTVLAEAPPSLAGRAAEAPPSPGVNAARSLPVEEAAPVPDRPVIRSVRVRPRTPVAGPKGTVRLVVEVVARGVTDRKGVTLRVEPGGRRRGRPRASAPSHRKAGAPRAHSGPSSQASAQGWEIWRFNPPVGLSRWYPSGRWQAIATARNARGARATASSSFQFRKRTAFSGVRMARARKRARALRMTGTLMRVDPTGRFDYWSFPRQRVTLQFRKHGKRSWKNVAKTRTNRDGYFARRVKRAHGRWRVFYPGTRNYAAVSASIRHVTRK
jgi:hypothetical protein